MLSKTHIAIGIASSYMLLQPKTIPEFITATIGGSLGGVMADIDIKIDIRNKFAAKAALDALYGEILAILFTACMLFGDFWFHSGIIQSIGENLARSVAGAVFFVFFIFIGKISDHRGRTHSIAALILFSVSVSLINASVGVAFFVGYASHLIIDLLNRRPIRLFYPFKRGICLKLFYADRFANEVLYITGVCAAATYVLLHASF